MAIKPATTTTPTGATLLDNAVCVSITLGRIGHTRKVSSDHVTVEADKDRIHVSKVILAAPELDAIAKADNAWRGWLAERALPATFFRQGVYLIPLALLAKVDAAWTTFETTRAALVDTFMKAYPRMIDESRVKLGDLFNVGDFPDPADIREAFTIKAAYVTFGVPGAALSKVSPALARRAADEFAARMDEAAQDVRDALRLAFAELVDDMIVRLQDREDGKPKAFRASSIERVQEFLSTFAARNLTNDAEVAALIGKAKALVNGADAETIKATPDTRQAIAKGFKGIQAALVPMIAAKKRAINRDDD